MGIESSMGSAIDGIQSNEPAPENVQDLQEVQGQLDTASESASLGLSALRKEMGRDIAPELEYQVIETKAYPVNNGSLKAEFVITDTGKAVILSIGDNRALYDKAGINHFFGSGRWMDPNGIFADIMENLDR